METAGTSSFLETEPESLAPGLSLHPSQAIPLSVSSSHEACGLPEPTLRAEPHAWLAQYPRLGAQQPQPTTWSRKHLLKRLNVNLDLTLTSSLRAFVSPTRFWIPNNPVMSPPWSEDSE